MPRLLRSLLFGFIGLVLALVILAAVASPFIVRRSFPQVNGEIHLNGVDGKVDIYQDKFGIPQIYAASQHDLFYAQGYVHAQDRFWQMDFWRHLGSGRLAEMFGKDQLENDAFLRTLGWERVAREELKQMDPDSRAILQAYADGVNAYLTKRSASGISLEYTILRLLSPDYKIEPWEPVNSLTWAKAMAWDLGGNMDSEIEHAKLLKILTPEQVAELEPPYPADHPFIVPDWQASAALNQMADLRAWLQSDEGLSPALQIVSQRFTALNDLMGPSGAEIGSNNWVISGKLTATGKPLLANDPHLSEQMPSIWYEIGLHCQPKGPDCPYEVTGFSFAGDPGVIIGHNQHIAWGVTNTGPDVQDLYIEKINPDNPNQYEVNGKWVDMQLVNETLQVSGAQPVNLTVRYTRHGPIISNTYGDLKDFAQTSGIDLPQYYAIALRWTALDPNFLFTAIWKLDRAQNWNDFRDAASYFSVPAQNLIYADVDGNIGYQMPGNIPIRAKGDGSLPVPGWTDEYEWSGYIPFDQLPKTFNPSQGFVVTANNAVVGANYPHLISTDWDYGFRAQRIVDMIQNAPGPINIAYIQKMQGDDKDLNAETLLPILLQLPLNDAQLENARAILQGWDMQDQMESAPAALFAAFWNHLLADTFNDELPEDYQPVGGSRWFEVMRRLVTQPDSPWWDNQTTTQVENRDQIFNQAFGEAVAELNKSLGNNPQNWSWGQLHTLTFHNQSLGKSGISLIDGIFNRGPFQTSGGSSIVNATGWNAHESYQVVSLPSMRMIVDLSDLQNSITIHTTGQSGHAYHNHYDDMADLWRNIQYHAMLWDQNMIKAQAASHLQLLP